MSTAATMREVFEHSARQWKRRRSLARNPNQFKDAQQHIKDCRKMVDFYRAKERETQQ